MSNEIRMNLPEIQQKSRAKTVKSRQKAFLNLVTFF